MKPSSDICRFCNHWNIGRCTHPNKFCKTKSKTIVRRKIFEKEIQLRKKYWILK